MLSTLAAERFSGISIQTEALTLVDVMTYATGRATAHTIIYSGACAAASEPVINDEHVATRWMTPEGLRRAVPGCGDTARKGPARNRRGAGGRGGARRADRGGAARRVSLGRTRWPQCSHGP